MTTRVLILGLLPNVLDDLRTQLDIADVEILSGSSIDDVRTAFAEGDINHVLIGGGLELRTRLAVVEEVFQSSDRPTVHMKDQMSGPEAFGPFVRSVLQGLDTYHPVESPRGVARVGEWLSTGLIRPSEYRVTGA